MSNPSKAVYEFIAEQVAIANSLYVSPDDVLDTEIAPPAPILSFADVHAMPYQPFKAVKSIRVGRVISSKPRVGLAEVCRDNGQIEILCVVKIPKENTAGILAGLETADALAEELIKLFDKNESLNGTVRDITVTDWVEDWSRPEGSLHAVSALLVVINNFNA